jgi:hypothetical protein
MSVYKPIVASKWSTLFNALTETLLEQATVPPGPNTKDRATIVAANQALVSRELNNWNTLTLDPNMSDAQFWRLTMTKCFYTGKRAPEAEKVDRAAHWLRDLRSVASSDWDIGSKIHTAYLADKTAHKNMKDLRRVREGAQNLVRRLNNNPGRRLIDIFVPVSDRGFDGDALHRIHQRIEGEFSAGFVTTLHMMTDLGIPVVKTDRKLTRTIVRLGLVKSKPYRDGEMILSPNIASKEALALGGHQKFSFRVQTLLREASAETGLSMRTIDWILVKMGMNPEPGVGLVNTVCADIPRCNVCKAKPLCAVGRNRK